FGLHVAQREENAGTMAICVAPPPAPVESVFTPEIAAEPERELAPGAPPPSQVEVPELQDPEWLPMDGWAELPPDESVVPPAEVLRPLDLGGLDRPSDLGSLARPGPAGTGASAPGPGAGVAGVGAGSSGGGGTGPGGPGTGTGAATGTGAVAPLPQILEPR